MKRCFHTGSWYTASHNPISKYVSHTGATQILKIIQKKRKEEIHSLIQRMPWFICTCPEKLPFLVPSIIPHLHWFGFNQNKHISYFHIIYISILRSSRMIAKNEILKIECAVFLFFFKHCPWFEALWWINWCERCMNNWMRSKKNVAWLERLLAIMAKGHTQKLRQIYVCDEMSIQHFHYCPRAHDHREKASWW